MYPLIMCTPENNFCNFNLSINDKTAENFKNCDIYIGDNDLLFCCDYFIQRFVSLQNFDTKDLKNLEIHYNTDKKEFNFKLPCLPLADEINIDNDDKQTNDKATSYKSDGTTVLNSNQENPIDIFDITKLQRITKSCVFFVNSEINNFTENFSYGFCGKHRQNTNNIENELSKICRIRNLSETSPISRAFQRIMDEKKDFSPDQYKLDFVELQVPEGHENPVKFTYSFQDPILSKEDQELIKIINSEKLNIMEDQKSEIECGLVSILLAICYDIRATSNEPTCESAWTRTILTPTLSYFEPMENLKTVIIAFCRRSMTYPLYRSYDLSRYCVNDAIEILKNGKNWILKQFLITYNLFLTSNDNRNLLIKYFINDYIRYLTMNITDVELDLLAKNLKNSFMIITKKTIQLNLIEIETELLRELIKDVQFSNSSSESYDSGEEIDYKETDIE